MGNKTTFTVEDGTTTIQIGGITITTDGNVTIDTGDCGCSDEPATCESQPEWIRDELTKFGFIPQEQSETVQYVPAGGVGESTTPIPDGFWAAQNNGNGIMFSFTLSVLSQYQINSLEITVSSQEEGEDPITFYANNNGSGITGTGYGSWQLQPGKSYCVSVSPGYSVE